MTGYPTAQGDSEATSNEQPAVAALRALSVFSADQAGAYREHFGPLAEVLGDGVETRLGRYVRRWAREGTPGVIVLTGNAGTGKTAVAEAFCRALQAPLPTTDAPAEAAPDRWVVKDLSGLSGLEARAAALQTVLAAAQERRGQGLVCANEGVLRDSLPRLRRIDISDAMETALRQGAAVAGLVTIVNVNRQRPTADGLWDGLLDYVSRAEIWGGCEGCPIAAGGCPMRSNAAALRNPQVRAQLRTLFRLGAGEAVPTLREVLSILSWCVVGGASCQAVKRDVRDQGTSAHSARDGYFARLMGGGLSADVVERSPLLLGMVSSGLGDVSDLEVDGWLRDTSNSPQVVQRLAGAPVPEGTPSGRAGDERDLPTSGALAGSDSPLDRVRTTQGMMTFHRLGETISTDEDPVKVEDALDALVAADGLHGPYQALWRQRLYFEAADALGGGDSAARRLLDRRHLTELVALAAKGAASADATLEIRELIRGLNFLVTGFSSPDEGLVVPDPACLFARDPGSFRPARPSLVHSRVQLSRLRVEVPDKGPVEDLLDVDHIDVDLVVDGDSALALRIGPRMYEAIREAAAFQGPVGQGVAEMNDLRGFYGRLAAATVDEAEEAIRIADPDAAQPGLFNVTLPYFAAPGSG